MTSTSASEHLKRASLTLLVVGGVVLGAAALAGPVHDLLVSWGWLEVSDGQPHKMFLKVFRRLLLIPLVAALALVFKPWRDGSPDDFGLKPIRAGLFAKAYGATLLAALGVLAVHFVFGWHEWETPFRPGKLAGRAGQYLAAGLVIAILEEAFFRGWLWSKLGRGAAPVRAAVVTSAIYAALHAFRPGALDDLDVSHDMAGALEALGAWLGHLADPVAFGPMFLGLFLFGLVLTALFARTKSLWAPIGVHAAGILFVYAHGAVTQDVDAAPWIVGTKRLFDGAPGWIVLGVAAAWLARPRPAPSEPA